MRELVLSCSQPRYPSPIRSHHFIATRVGLGLTGIGKPFHFRSFNEALGSGSHGLDHMPSRATTLGQTVTAPADWG